MVQCIEICLTLSPSLNVEPALILQLLDGLIDGGFFGANRFSHCFLTGEDVVVIPSITEQLCVHDFGSEGQCLVIEQTIGNLGKTTGRDRVKALQNDVFPLSEAGDVG